MYGFELWNVRSDYIQAEKQIPALYELSERINIVGKKIEEIDIQKLIEFELRGLDSGFPKIVEHPSKLSDGELAILIQINSSYGFRVENGHSVEWVSFRERK
jgi:hypothetical protein